MTSENNVFFLYSMVAISTSVLIFNKFRTVSATIQNDHIDVNMKLKQRPSDSNMKENPFRYVPLIC